MQKQNKPQLDHFLKSLKENTKNCIKKVTDRKTFLNSMIKLKESSKNQNTTDFIALTLKVLFFHKKTRTTTLCTQI